MTSWSIGILALLQSSKYVPAMLFFEKPTASTYESGRVLTEPRLPLIQITCQKLKRLF
jgi:hypothetical protein